MVLYNRIIYNSDEYPYIVLMGASDKRVMSVSPFKIINKESNPS